ncbi:ATP-binding protein [Solirubrobacter soli]|uniref:ATP-binding protein n=1 Tax=Solirubrobacter soli TaxID=363832 RepID=UPI0003F7EE29|nr:AAA family ATPase [Solirubrobacter soli]
MDRASAVDGLLARETELRALAGLIADGGRIVVFEGGAGMGKTALLEAARAQARSAGSLVLSARGDELETAYPYGVVRQWLEREWNGDPGDAAGLVLSRSPERAPAGEDASFGIRHALYLFVSDLSRARPVLLILDDAQWADPESLRFLAYVKHRLEGLHAGVVVATRPEGSELLAHVRGDPAVEVCVLRSLDVPASAQLLERTLGATVGPGFCAACVGATGGNPLYLRELGRALGAEDIAPDDGNAALVQEIGVTALSAHVLRRVTAAGESALALAGAMSVLAEGSALRHAAAIAGIELQRAGAAAKRLVGAEVLRSQDPVHFEHPIIRRIVAEQLSSVERDELHLAAARELLEGRAPPEQAAAHLLLTRPRAGDSSVATLRAAAADAMSRSAFATAAEYLRRALEEPPDPAAEVAVGWELGVAEALVPDPRAIGHLGRAHAASRDPIERGEIAFDLASAHIDLFQPIQACQVLEAAIAELGSDDDELRQRLEAALLMSAWLETQTIAAGIRVLGKYWDRAPPGPAGRAILAQQAMAMLATGHPAEAVRAVARAAVRDAGEEDGRGTFEVALIVLIRAEDFGEAAAVLDRALALRSVRMVRRRMASLESLGGYLALQLGALGEAELRLRGALALTPEAAGPGAWLVVRGLLAAALTSRGDLDEAARVLADGPPEPWPRDRLSILALAARAELSFLHGRFAEALADLERIGELQAESGGASAVAVHHWRAYAALALNRLGRTDEARGLLAEELERVRAFGAPVTSSITLRAAGIVEGGRLGLERLQDAVSVLGDSPAALERALAHVELGAALRRDNQRRAAREHLDAGLRLAQRWEARPLAERAYGELLASGARLRRADLADRDALTASELRIAQHAAKGLTNREIAGQLYLSIKTVEMHLGRVYRKLGIKARAELAQALQQHA